MDKKIEKLNKKIKKLEEEITECRQINKNLKKSEEKLSAIFNSARDGIVLLDETGKITAINKMLIEIGGYTEEEIVGKRIAALKMFTPKSIVKMMAAFAKRMATGKEIPPYEVEAKTKKGEKKFAEINASCLKMDGKIIGGVAIIRDITERKKAEDELKKRTRSSKNLIN